MKSVYFLASVVLASGAAFAATPASAASNQPDQAKVEAGLNAQGYAKWKRIELDNGIWEVDDAIDSAGRQFDLRIDGRDLKTISKVAE